MPYTPLLPALVLSAMTLAAAPVAAQTGACENAGAPPTPALTAAEKSEGWTALWDGSSTSAWRGVKTDDFPKHGWRACGNVLTIMGKGGEESRGGGDIISRERYADFELTLEAKLTPGANSGVKIFTQPNLAPIDRLTGKPAAVGSAIGMEFQLLDDERHPDAKLGRDGNRTIGSLYDLVPAGKDKTAAPVGQWNHVRILARGKSVTFWLNGRKTVEVERGSAAFRSAVATSKFRDIPGFGEWPDGHILLQDHGDQVSFRNILIRDLRAK
ncbi:3-keto-disaccharide hydrolase [Burkholderia sp. LMU1-1-1.1]|uniref:3-keto-disaccharide hydrolase n=1 Tax=Burkholderia sp. LMU1-1-1.1 TaxID=3135266 RepID=UPI00343A62EA